MKQKWIRLLSISLLVHLLSLAGMTAEVLAAGSEYLTTAYPNVKVPTVHVPEVHEPESNIPENIPPGQVPSTPANNLPETVASPSVADSVADPDPQTVDPSHGMAVKTKEWIQKVSKMVVGTRSVLYKAASNMDDQGRISGSMWNYVSQYVLELAMPWIDTLPVENIDPYAKSTELAGKTKELKKFAETYKSLKDMTTVENGGLRPIGPNFSILGGTASMIIGGYEVFQGLQGDSRLSQQEQTVEFYMGAGDLFSGLGTAVGGIATLVAGTAVAPGLAVAGTVLFAAGILLAAMAYGMKYLPWFRESSFGRGLTRFRKQLAGFLGRF